MVKLVLTVVLYFLLNSAESKAPPPCESSIFCHGPLLHTVQMSGIFKDSKTFVDMKLRFPPPTVLSNFETFMMRQGPIPTKAQILNFVQENFEPEGSEFEVWDPLDWQPDPKFLRNISDPNLRFWAADLHSFWKQLGRKIKEDVKTHPELYSMIYTSHPVIVPGGRFREFFYWDTYWIMKGLLLSQMTATVKGMLENFIEMVNLLGYIPNGGRVYFRRSQPPLLIPMMKEYLDATNDVQFLKDNLPALEMEFQFWLNNRNVTVESGGQHYRAIRYNVEMTGPRPESYREDFELGETLQTDEQREELYYNLKAGAESGWDFSSRWFSSDPHVDATLVDTKTRDIIPVDLNAFLQLNAKTLADFHRLTGSPEKAVSYDNVANEWRTMLDKLLWDEEFGVWFDYDMVKKQHRKQFYASNLTPLWTGAYQTVGVVDRVIEYLKMSGALEFPGGIPTSMKNAGEQWDYPNGWAPLQHLIVEALDRSGSPEAQNLAQEIAERWIMSNYRAYSEANKMFEKYDVTIVGLPGGGGEYEVVVGFGWTNGVVLDFLNRFGNKLTTPVESTGFKPENMMGSSMLLASISVLLASLLGISQIGRCKEGFDAIKSDNDCIPYDPFTIEDKLPLIEGILPPALSVIESHG